MLALAGNQELEIAGGDTITATYIDEVVPGDSGRARVLTASLTATYFNADVSPIVYDFARAYDGGVNVRPRRVLRIEPGERFIVQVRDYDEDRSNDPDTVPHRDRRQRRPAGRADRRREPAQLGRVHQGDRYVGQGGKGPHHDQAGRPHLLPLRGQAEHVPGPRRGPRDGGPGQRADAGPGADPGHAGQAAPPAGSKAPPTITYRRPPEGRDVSQVALAGPLTVEVIDPDAAKDAESSVIVALTAAEGVKLDVRCVLPPNRQGQGNDDALTEGRFVGQVFLQLGGQGSPDLVPLTTGLPRLDRRAGDRGPGSRHATTPARAGPDRHPGAERRRQGPDRRGLQRPAASGRHAGGTRGQGPADRERPARVHRPRLRAAGRAVCTSASGCTCG